MKKREQKCAYFSLQTRVMEGGGKDERLTENGFRVTREHAVIASI